MEHVRGAASELHARALPDAGRHLWWLEVDAPALVLGSTQPVADADAAACDAAGVAVARRRSGGGAVLVEPGETLWADVLLPAGDPLWDDDVGRAVWWVGDAWRQALADLGLTGCTVHRGPMVTTAWSRRVCFDGLGPGEVVGPSGAKVVGISQRRTRHMARFQCALNRAWRPERIAGLLAAPRPLPGELSPVTAVDVSADAVHAAFSSALDAAR